MAARTGSLAAAGAPFWPGAAFGNLLGLRRNWPIEIFERELVGASIVLADDDAYMTAGFESPEQDFVCKRLLDRFLNEPGHGPRAHLLVIAMLDQPVAGAIGELDRYVAVA